MEDLIEALSYCIFFSSKLSTIYSSVGDTAFALFIFNFLLNVYLFIYLFFNSLIWYNLNLRKLKKTENSQLLTIFMYRLLCQ